MKLFPCIDFLTHYPNCSHRSVSWSAPRIEVKLCYNLNFASLAGLSLEIPIIPMFSLVNASPNAKNYLASLIQPDVSAHGKNMTTFLPIFSVNENLGQSLWIDSSGAKLPSLSLILSPSYQKCAPNEIATCIMFQL